MTDTKRIIHSIWFDKDTAECSLTSESQGGPASQMETVLLKANSPLESDLSDQEREYLSYIGEEFTPLQKQKSNNNSLSSVKSDAGEEQENLTKGNKMSDQNVVEQEAINKARDAKIAKLEKALMQKEIEKYNLDNSEAVASALVELEDEKSQELIKAFAAIEKTAEVAITKSKETPLDKAFEEAGEDGEAEVEVEKSLAERIEEKRIEKAKAMETK